MYLKQVVPKGEEDQEKTEQRLIVDCHFGKRKRLAAIRTCCSHVQVKFCQHTPIHNIQHSMQAAVSQHSIAGVMLLVASTPAAFKCSHSSIVQIETFSQLQTSTKLVNCLAAGQRQQSNSSRAAAAAAAAEGS